MANKHHTQVVPREVNEAIDDVTRAILDVLHKAGLDVAVKNTPEGRRQFMKALEDEQIGFQKTLHPDRPGESGTRILKAGIQIGFIPALGVVAKDGKKVIV